LFKNYKWC